MNKACCALALFLPAGVAAAQQAVAPRPAAVAAPAHADLEGPVRRFVERHPSRAGLRPEVEFGEVRQNVPPCTHPVEVSFSGRAKPWGRVSFHVRCDNPAWRVNVPAAVRMYGEYWAAARYVGTSAVLAESDLQRIEGDLAALPEDVARANDNPAGRATLRSFAAGSAIQLNALRDPAVIRAGDRVRVQLNGRDFQVGGEGVAISAGAVGDTIRIRMQDGQQLQAQIVKTGLVQIRLE